MRVLLDSSAYSQLMRGREQVRRIVRGAEEVLLSAVVLGELLYGFRRGSRYERNARQIRAFLDNPYVSFVPVGATSADRYSRIAASLRAKGRPFPPTTSGSRLTPWRRGPIWCRLTATSSMRTGSRGFG